MGFEYCKKRKTPTSTRKAVTNTDLQHYDLQFTIETLLSCYTCRSVNFSKVGGIISKILGHFLCLLREKFLARCLFLKSTRPGNSGRAIVSEKEINENFMIIK